jgi:hypothetical protein
MLLSMFVDFNGKSTMNILYKQTISKKNTIYVFILTLLHKNNTYVCNNSHITIYIFINIQNLWWFTIKRLPLWRCISKDIYCMPDIKKKIKSCGFTTQQIAERLGISQQAVSQAINGNPTLSRLEEIAGAVGIPVSELVADDPASIVEPQQKCPYCGHELTVKIE